MTSLLWNVALYLLPSRNGEKWELLCVGFGVVVARCKSGFFGLRGSNFLGSRLLVSLGTSVTDGMSSLSTSAVPRVSVSLSMMDSSSSHLSGSWGSTVPLCWDQIGYQIDCWLLQT